MSSGSIQLVLVGATHHTAPLEVRERLALPREKQDALTADLRRAGTVEEVCVLNTCNRVEIYAMATGTQAGDRIAENFCRLQGLDPCAFSAASLRLHGAEAVRHLFEVAAGLDSQMVGETEILNQVKEAYAAAQTTGTVGAALNRVFQKALHSAKVVRTETGIGRGQVSVATVAVGLAEKIFGHLRRSRVLVVGAGEIATNTAKALRSREAGDVTFCNRTTARAEELAQEFGGGVLPFERLAHGLGDFDIVVCSTAAPDVVLRLPTVYEAMHRRPSRPLFLIDLALPRDVDPGAASLPNVFLYNLDDLAGIAEDNIAQRKAEITRARALVAARAEAIWRKVAGEAPGHDA